MKFHRPLLVAGLVSVGSVLFVAHAQNTEAQNKALEALRKAQSGQASPSTPSPARVTESEAQRNALQALREQQAGGRSVSTAPAAPAGNAAQQKALEALRGGQPATPTAPAAPAVVTASPAQVQALEALRRQQIANPVAISEQPSAKQSQAVQALNDKWSAAAGTTAQAAPAPAVVAPEPEKPKGPMTKMERLAELTRRYKADELTPQEYHTQRAKIVAEP
jgi:hypothetical protein